MAQALPKIRLYLSEKLVLGEAVPLTREQAHYLGNVMRLSAGAETLVFNGREGEWRAELVEIGKRGGQIAPLVQTRAQTEPPDLSLAFAPIKKARTDFIAEKACEMGCRSVYPVFTEFTNSERVRTDRLQAHMIEAAEQCGILSVPLIHEPMPLDAYLRESADRKLMFCDESGAGEAARDVLTRAGGGAWSVLIGPEGGFSPAEAERLRRAPNVWPVSLGPRILRADTAAVAALTVWQSVLGDWAGPAAAPAQSAGS